MYVVLPWPRVSMDYVCKCAKGWCVCICVDEVGMVEYLWCGCGWLVWVKQQNKTKQYFQAQSDPAVVWSVGVKHITEGVIWPWPVWKWKHGLTLLFKMNTSVSYFKTTDKNCLTLEFDGSLLILAHLTWVVMRGHLLLMLDISCHLTGLSWRLLTLWKDTSGLLKVPCW